MIRIVISAIALYSGYKIYKFIKCPKELEHLPAAPMSSLLAFAFSKDSFNDKMKDTLQPMMDKHGVIRVLGVQGWTLFIGDPHISREISMKPEIFGKPDFTKFPLSKNIYKLFGKSQVVGNNGTEWKRHRKIINPIFTKSWPTELFGDCVKDLIDEWEKMDGQDVVVQELIERMTLDVLGKTIFDMDFKSVKDPDSPLVKLYNDIIHQVLGQPIYFILPFLEKLPFFSRPKLSKQIDDYHDFIDNIMKLRKEEMQNESDNHRDNLITALIRANENTDDRKLTHEEIRDNIKVFILAGHDTTSNTLTSTLYYLARYPEIQEKLREEILEAMGYPKEVTIPTVDQLKRMSYLDQVNKESMRVMTTTTNVQRASTETHTLSNGLVVPKDTLIFLHLWGMHHNESIYPNPDEFDPERFKDVSSEESRAWQPFTLGSRTCIGITFSMMEQRVTIAMLLQRFTFSIENDNPDYDNLRLSPIGIICPIDMRLKIQIR